MQWWQIFQVPADVSLFLVLGESGRQLDRGGGGGNVQWGWGWAESGGVGHFWSTPLRVWPFSSLKSGVFVCCVGTENVPIYLQVQ